MCGPVSMVIYGLIYKDHILGKKTRLNKLKTENIQSIYSDNKEIKFEINRRKTKHVKIKQHTLNLWINDEITRRTGNYYETNENENRCPDLWDSVKAVLSG